MHLVGLDYILVGVYLALMAFIGLFLGWFVKDVGSYLKGGNTIPWAISGVSNYMSMFTTFVFVAYAGIAYEHGLVSVTVFLCTVPPCLVAGRFMAARWRRAQLTTPVEYLERRFNLGVRQTFSWMGMLMRFLDNAVRLYASGIFIATVTPLSVAEAIILSGILITLFTMIGGLWAVTVMDTIQFILLFFSALIVLPLALDAAGGLSGIAAESPESLHWFNGPKGAPLWLLAYYLMVTLKYNGNWSFIQRLYSVRDEAASRKVAYCSAFLFTVTPLVFLLPAVAARVVLPDLQDPEESYVAICVHLLPAGMMGLMIASMFSATMSALNSEFNVMAGVLTNDLYKRIIAPQSSDRAQLIFARVMTVAVGALITTGAIYVGHFGGAFEANKIFTGIFAIPLAVPLIFGLVLARPNPSGALFTVIGGAAIALVLNLNTLTFNHKGYDLDFVSVSDSSELIETGDALIIVALVNDDLHIRVFDEDGSQVVNSSENELTKGWKLSRLKKYLNGKPFPDEAKLSEKKRSEIIKKAASVISGHAHLKGWFSWEISTLITIAVCIALFLLSGVISPCRDEKAKDFLEKVSRPLPPEAIPEIEPRLGVALFRLFAISLFVAGGFFVLVGSLSAAEISGRLALVAGALCLVIGGVFLRKSLPRTDRKTGINEDSNS